MRVAEALHLRLPEPGPVEPATRAGGRAQCRGDVAGPLESEEAILYADIDVKRVNEERIRLDPAGHYGRPDVFRLEVDRKRHEHFYEADE